MFETAEEAEKILNRQGATSDPSFFPPEPTFEPPKDDINKEWEIPALETNEASEPVSGASANFLSLRGDVSDSPEVALLLDHLSLGKEENREIIRLANESMAKVTDMSESIVALKDEVIELKNNEIQTLKDKLNQQEELIRKLQQEKEDLQMLVESLD